MNKIPDYWRHLWKLRLKKDILTVFCIAMIQLAGAQETSEEKENRSKMLIGFGVNYLYMKPLPQAQTRNFTINFPGIYFRAGGEFFVNETRFIHSEMYMSINKGSMDNGLIKTSRLNYNYGIGWDYRAFKWSLNPGFCFVSVAYQDNVSTKTITETRFAPSAGIQFDLVLLDKDRQYLSFFTESGVMITLNSKWVNQIASGINWKPSFSKPKKQAVSPL